MTGMSIPWKMTPKEFKAFLKYCKKPVSAAMIAGGGALMLEHLFEFGGFDLLDFWGHEYLGIGLILTGFLISMHWEQWYDLKLWKIRNWWR